jgi:hypothetical protein
MLLSNSSLDAILRNLMNLMISLENSNSTNSNPKVSMTKNSTNYKLQFVKQIPCQYL